MERSMTGEEVSVGRTKTTSGKPANQKGWRFFQQRPSCLGDELTWNVWDVEGRNIRTPDNSTGADRGSPTFLKHRLLLWIGRGYSDSCKSKKNVLIRKSHAPYYFSFFASD